MFIFVVVNIVSCCCAAYLDEYHIKTKHTQLDEKTTTTFYKY